MIVEWVRGDITRLEVDAVVNAANRDLAGGGGVDGAIHLAAGAKDLQEACRLVAPCEVGEAKVTPGFNLPAKHIIHTVGPIWQGGTSDEERLLATCYLSSIAAAEEIGARSVAFPLISTGVYGYPLEDAVTIAVATLQSMETSVENAVLVAFDDEAEMALEGTLV